MVVAGWNQGSECHGSGRFMEAARPEDPRPPSSSQTDTRCAKLSGVALVFRKHSGKASSPPAGASYRLISMLEPGPQLEATAPATQIAWAIS